MQPDEIKRSLLANDAALLRELAESQAGSDARNHKQRLAQDDDLGPSDLSQASWPNPLRAAAFHGVAGDLVHLIEPHSETDPAAILIQFLTGFGNLIHRSAHFIAEADQHFTSLYAVIVGQTSKGRKGTSWGQVRRVLERVDPAWVGSRVVNGLASGEGLISALGNDDASDKRLLVVETEFARVLQMCEREGNILSTVIREAWDTGSLRTMTRKEPLHAEGGHVSIIGHITRDELRRRLTDTAAANGFANRFLWVCARRSRLLPDGGTLQTVDFGPIVERLQASAKFAKEVGELRRDDAARAIWHGVYPSLSEGQPGLFGAVTSRSETQSMRLACIYAVLSCSAVIRAEHLLAALAVWQYCEASARFVFGASLGDAIADEIVRELQHRPEGMTRTEIREHFSNNKRSADIERALNLLQEYGRARMASESDGPGRPRERWYAVNAINAVSTN